MKKYFVLCVLVILFGCKQDRSEQNDIVDTQDDVTVCIFCDDEWWANPIAIIEDSKVNLIWNKPPPICAERLNLSEFTFNIYVSENNRFNFQKLIEINNDENYSYTVDKLQNGNSYFFYIVSNRNGFEPLYSDTIMAVPNKRKEFETLLANYSSCPLGFSIARQKNKITYFDVDFSLNGGSDLYMSNLDGSEKELLFKTTANSGNPRWSPTNGKITFYTAYPAQRGIVSYSIPVIELYDFKTESIMQLTTKNESSVSPVFSENGELLLFVSTKPHDSYEGILGNIWLKNLITDDLFQITDFSKTSIICDHLCWIDNDRFLFHGRYFHDVYHIGEYQLFESSVSKKQITKVFESRWNDYSPSISPDQRKIAFFSDRSGSNQVWIYHIDSKTYSQISPYSINEGVNQYLNIEWLDNSTIVFTIYDNHNHLIRQRVE